MHIMSNYTLLIDLHIKIINSLQLNIPTNIVTACILHCRQAYFRKYHHSFTVLGNSVNDLNKHGNYLKFKFVYITLLSILYTIFYPIIYIILRLRG